MHADLDSSFVAQVMLLCDSFQLAKLLQDAENLQPAVGCQPLPHSSNTGYNYSIRPCQAEVGVVEDRSRCKPRSKEQSVSMCRKAKVYVDVFA